MKRIILAVTIFLASTLAVAQSTFPVPTCPPSECDMSNGCSGKPCTPKQPKATPIQAAYLAAIERVR